jgi:hypothetical protein
MIELLDDRMQKGDSRILRLADTLTAVSTQTQLKKEIPTAAGISYGQFCSTALVGEVGS